MIEMIKEKDYWLFRDEWDNIWKLVPTGDIHMPLIIYLYMRKT